MKNNKIQYKRQWWILVIALLMSPIIKAQSDKALVREGNKEFNKGKYDEAEIKYRKALDKNKQKYTAQFNLGDALYQQKNYEKAAETFSKTNAEKTTAVDKSNVYYNLGNAKLKAGKLDESIAAYKQALRENPKNENARYNLEYARQRKQKQQNKKNQKKKDQKKDQNKDKNKQDQQKKDKDKQDQQKKDQNQDQKKQDQQNQQQKDGQQGQQNKQQSQKISKKDAERMLAALKNNEKKTLEKLKKAKKANTKVVKTEKDW